MSDGSITQILEAPYIVVSTAASDICTVVLHEVGHIFDKTIALCESGVYEGTFYKISGSENWQMLYTKYYDTLISIDGRMKLSCSISASEAFAESFRLYCRDPEKMASVIPEVFLYMQQLVEAFT